MVDAPSEPFSVISEHMRGAMSWLTDTFVPVVGLLTGTCDTNVTAWKVRSAVSYMLNQHQVELEEAITRCSNGHHGAILERVLVAVEKIVLNRQCFEVDHRVKAVLSTTDLAKAAARAQ